jgi:hypothetical protein
MSMSRAGAAAGWTPCCGCSTARPQRTCLSRRRYRRADEIVIEKPFNYIEHPFRLASFNIDYSSRISALQRVGSEVTDHSH